MLPGLLKYYNYLQKRPGIDGTLVVYRGCHDLMNPKIVVNCRTRPKATCNTMEEPKLHIIVIDDDRYQALSLIKIIDDTGLADEVAHFSNGQEALDHITGLTQLGSTLPDIIFLDINMPVMGGWKFLYAYGRLKRLLYKQVAVYMVTSSTEGADMGKSRHYDTVKGYIVKPVTKEKVYQVLKAATSQY